MKQIFFFAIIAALVWACGNSSGTDTASGSNAGQDGNEAETVAVAEKADGEALYKTYCVTCHGLYGDMGASGAYNLQESKLSLEERIAVITNGRKAMTAFESLLDKKEIKAVAKYTMKLSEE